MAPLELLKDLRCEKCFVNDKIQYNTIDGWPTFQSSYEHTEPYIQQNISMAVISYSG